MSFKGILEKNWTTGRKKTFFVKVVEIVEIVEFLTRNLKKSSVFSVNVF